MANKTDIEVRRRQKEMYSGDNALQAFKRSHAKSKALDGMKRGIHEIGRGHGVVKGPVGLKSYSDKNK